MANIDNELNAIARAAYGREVRGSIGDALKKMNDDFTAQSISDFSEVATAATGITIESASEAYKVSGRRMGILVTGPFTSGSHGKTHIATIDADHIPATETGITGYVDTSVGTYQPITGSIDATDGKLYIYTPNIDTAYDSATIYFDYFCGL